MLQSKSKLPIAEATTDMMIACALATARAASTSMVQGMTFWSRMLRSSVAQSAPTSLTVSSDASTPRPDAESYDAPEQPPAETPADAAFSSYRSSSGHAVAQVIVADATAPSVAQVSEAA